MSLLLTQQETIASCCISSLIGAFPIWMLAATASSWLIPSVNASPGPVSSDHDHGNVGESSIENDEDVGYESTESPLDNDVIDEVEHDHDHVVEDEEYEYNPMGLQVWLDEDSFVQALEGGRLVLAVIMAPWCERGNVGGIYDTLASAAELLDETFESITSTDSNFPPVTKPLIGIMDPSSVEEFTSITITSVPELKFVLTTFPKETEEEEEETMEDDINGQMQTWDYLGPKETARDFHESVLMYWYRSVVSDALTSRAEMSNDDYEDEDEDAVKPPIFTFASQLQMMKFLDNHGDRLLRPAQATRRHESKLESEMFNFYMGQQTDEKSSHIGGIFHPYQHLEEHGDTISRSECSQSHESDDVECIQEIDPFILLVQCRSKIDYGKVELDAGEVSAEQLINWGKQLTAKHSFDELAEEMSHRRDVAFFALNATSHNDETTYHDQKVCDGLFGGIEENVNGAVVFLRARRYVTYSVAPPNDRNHDEQDDNVWSQHQKRSIRHVRTDWDEVKQLHPRAIFVPTAMIVTKQHKEIHGKVATKDPDIPIEYVQSNLVASTVVHSTPTVIWFDRDRMAQLAFPWYRKIHAVLFVDSSLAYNVFRPAPPQTSDGMHPPPLPSFLNPSAEITQLMLNQQKAVQMFYNAALHHRAERPADDVVFLIVPSSEIRIMNSFGIDIWTPLDEALFGTVYEDQSSDNNDDINESSNDESGYCSTSQKEENQSTLPVMMITDSSGRSGMQSNRYYLCSNDIFSSSSTAFDDGGAMGEFIDRFFEGTIGKPFIRSETSLPSSQTSSDQATNLPINNTPNVTVLIGNTFESLVMDRNDEHTMLLMTTISCGHCKRFSIFWNELSSLVQAMKWSSIINVMKIDVSKNDVPHEKINAWDLPSVYYFPAGEKNDPIEMIPIKDKTNPQNDYDEGLSWVTSGYDLVKWMVDQGKLDLELLLQLDSSIHDGEIEKDIIGET